MKLQEKQLIGNYFKNLRKKKKISVYETRKQTGLSYKQISGIESGEASYTIDTFLRVSKFLGCSFFLHEKKGSSFDNDVLNDN